MHTTSLTFEPHELIYDLLWQNFHMYSLSKAGDVILNYLYQLHTYYYPAGDCVQGKLKIKGSKDKDIQVKCIFI